MSTHVNVITGSGSTTYQVGSGFRGPQGIQGNTGETGATGAQGDRAGLKYRFDTHTSPGAPSPGHLKFNSSTLSDVTRIMIRDTDLDGTSTSALLELIDDSTSAIKARVVIRSNSNSDTSHFNFLVTSVTDEGNHHHINGTYVSGSAFDSNEIVAFDFFVTGDKGDTGQTGPATQLSVSGTTTGAAGSEASVIISGTAPNQSLAFTIPQGIQGIQGIQGPTGSSGATAVLTGYVSGAGTVLATDTVIQAVGKLNGNDELKAPIASLYPYIGGKLLTYLDEEAAIADPLISAGDIYRKTAGGVDYVNPDNVPSLDLRFAADKTLTARRGPTPTFTRGSGATYIGSDGLIHGVDTSTTSNSISVASKTFVLDATAGQDQLWRTGDAVEASNGSNIMTGTVTSYNATTQSLVCNMTTASGTGTYTSWRIGYRGPRFDHDPVTLACRGLLIEEGRTNLAPQSQNFASGSWDGDATTKTSGLGGGLDGSPTVGQFSRGSITGFSINYPRNTSVNFSSGVTYTVSAWLALGSGSPTVKFSYYNGGWITSSALALTTTLTRYTWTVTAAGTPSLGVGLEISASTPYGVKIWGFQIEAGSFATSYIPTTTGTLARSADVCSITGANFTSFYTQSEGALFAQTQKTSTNSNAFIISVSDNSFNNEIDLRYNSVSQVASLMNVSNVNQLVGLQANITSGSAVKQSIAYKLNDCAYAANGASPISDTSALIPTVDRLTIGNVAVAGQAFYLNGTIAAIRYYKKRLPNAKLQALTA